ncbi:formate dehydrogenase [Skermanella stibiiresistens SB22]|uniref:Formate dehydrogenase n=1 Tax=Skermanella stibiiresistens SB22 TaxID=1385369 RepID=W9H9F1_9PROT|nr:twin-arginine translocation signal domain-containing protein [Skermanella stibiiresistens]EWY41371.1 formate dehydrogenase [Skermanella stibiiresistens SB22]
MSARVDPKVDEPGMERRRFLRVMGAGAAGAAAAPLLVSGPAEAAETPDQRVKQRYRETDHVKKYYQTNRF